MIVVGDCPNCGESVRAYFGRILNVGGPEEKAQIKCSSCKSEMTVFAKEKRIELGMDKQAA